MLNVTIDPSLDPIEVNLVQEYMTKVYPNVTFYTMTKGNDCIWLYYSHMNMYFIFHNGKIHDVQID